MGNRRLYKIECVHTLGTPGSEWVNLAPGIFQVDPHTPEDIANFFLDKQMGNRKDEFGFSWKILDRNSLGVEIKGGSR